MEVSLWVCTDEADVPHWWLLKACAHIFILNSGLTRLLCFLFVYFLFADCFTCIHLVLFSFLLAYSLTHVIILLSPNWPIYHSDGDVIMMLPVTRFKGQPAGMVTTTTPWLSVSTDPSPQWLWLASWSAATYQAMPPLVFYPPAVWIPEHAQLMQVTWHTWTDHRCCQTFVSWFIVCRWDLFECCCQM